MKIFNKYISIILLLIFFFSSSKDISGQFYNGHQMTFGKNRVQYINKYWRYHRYDRFDTYYYKEGDSLSREVAEIAKRKLPEIENFFGHGLQNRLIFLCYKRLSDFRESNIGYDPGEDDSNIGGVTRIIENKVFVYYEGDRETLEKQLTTGITQVVINDMLYSGSYSKRFTNSSLIELPEWYQSGLISYLTEEWSFDIEDRIKDGFKSKKFKRINHLTGEDAKYAGHSFWYFIGETYGRDVIPNILYLTKINKNSESGFKYVLGMSVKDLSIIWKEFFKERFGEDGNEIFPDESNLIVRAKKNIVFQNVKISPSGRYIAFVSNNLGKYKVNIYDSSTEKIKVVRKKGHKLDQITDFSYPVIAWHPGSNILAFFTEEKGRIRFYTYNIENKELIRRNVLFFDKILSASYSDDGFLMALSASIKGQTDIYIYNLAAGNYDQITNDPADDFDPYFTDNSSKIIFSSYRHHADNVNKDELQKDLYICDLFADGNKIQRLTESILFNETEPKDIKKDNYLSLTDKSGIINRQIIQYDSTISYIDTSIHYRYFISERQQSNYTRNIKDYDINKADKKVSEIFFHDNRYKIFNSDYKDETTATISPSVYRQSLNEKIRYNDSINKIERENARIQQIRIDSLRANPPANLLHPDSIPVDINNYVFEYDRKLQYYDLYPIEDTILNPRDKEDISTFNYLTNFYTNYIVQQVDFGFLNNSYQAFTGGAYYFNPGVNIFTKIGVHDLFEDYRISGAFRIGANLNSYEYLFSFEDFKYKIDKQYIYHRQTFEKQYVDTFGLLYQYEKVYSNEVMFIMKYPFNQVSSVKGTLSLRHDRGIFLSTDISTLALPSYYQFFSGLKLEYNFDNVRSLGVNLYDGIRFKIFGEYYQEVDQLYTNLFVLGADFRFYKKIHRNLIYAGRFAGSSSFGKSKLLYYLGGVDNWYSLSQKNPQFDNSVNINYQENYVYQAVATNMRGFIQNARNGTNFFVINNEIRFPIIRYLANRPLNSAFLNNFQIVGFADIGSAWSGLTPFDESNAYNTETVNTPPVKVIVDKNRWPVIFGYGAGLRSKLFGYFFRLDWAWGIDNYIILPRAFYFSLSLDF